MVKRWYTDFKCGCTDTNNAECSNRPNSVVVLENIKKLHKLVLANHKLKLHDIAEELKISEGQCIQHFARTFVNNKVAFKVGAAFAHSRSKTTMHQQFRALFATMQCNKEFLCKYVTMDETWIPHFTPELNRQSAEWTPAGKSCPNQPKTQTLTGKVLASIFWDAH